MEFRGNAGFFHLVRKVLLFRRTETAVRINGKDEGGNCFPAESFQRGGKRTFRRMVADVEFRPHVRNA